MTRTNALLVMVPLTFAHAALGFAAGYGDLLDSRPIPSITLNGTLLYDARVVGVGEMLGRGQQVTVEGKAASGRTERVNVPLAEARKNWRLESRMRAALAAMDRDEEKRKSERAEKDRAEAARVASGLAVVSGRVVSVLPDGVLMMNGPNVIKLVTGRNLADGEEARASARKTDAVFEYTTALGAKATVRVWEEVPDDP